ncbi:nucleosome assembly protein [Haematococcus lacustris]
MTTEAIEARLGLHSSPEEFVDSLPAHVQRRVEALQALQEKHEELAGEFRKELALLEAKYERLYGPLYAERSEVVSGAKAVALKDGDKAEGEDKGIPEFWLTALLKCDVTAELIKDKDIDVLKYLKDITSEPLVEDEVLHGFKLKFVFNENPYFTNTVLEKAYHMLPEDDGVLEKAEGTKIEWKAGKDVTIKIMKKKPKKGAKPDAKPQIKTEKVDSFFNFFSPPEVPQEDEEMEEEAMDELQATIEADYEVGAIIREKIIPNAVGWFTGEAIDDDDGFGMDGYDDEDDMDGEDDEDDGDDDDDEEPSPPPKGKKGKGGKAGKGGEGAPAEQPAECKQQ